MLAFKPAVGEKASSYNKRPKTRDILLGHRHVEVECIYMVDFIFEFV